MTSGLIITAINVAGENTRKTGVFVTHEGEIIKYDPSKPFDYADPEGRYFVHYPANYDPNNDYNAKEDKLKQETQIIASTHGRDAVLDAKMEKVREANKYEQ